jgi:hypothetical protein
MKRKDVLFNTETGRLERAGAHTESGYREVETGGSITIPGPYASNAEAVAALGVGRLYKSSTLSVNGSPYILITV